MRVGSRRGVQRNSRIDELLWVNGVGGKEDVLRGTVGQLLRERRGGAEGRDEVDAGSALVSRGERGHYGLEIGSAGDLELLGLRADDGSEGCQDEESEEGSAHKATVV